MRIFVGIVIIIVVLAILSSVLEWVFDHIIYIIILAATIAGFIIYPRITVVCIAVCVLCFILYCVFYSVLQRKDNPDSNDKDDPKVVLLKGFREEQQERIKTDVKLPNNTYLLVKTGDSYCEKLLNLDRLIANENIYNCLIDITQTVSKILAYIIEHPERTKDASKLFDYYLPTIETIVNAYIRFEESEIESIEVNETKQEIESVLLEVSNALVSLLNSLLLNDSMDVSAEISAMRKIIEQDGLNPSAFYTK